jgi:hypothetical protein
MTCSQIWLIPLVEDRHKTLNPKTFPHKTGGKKERKTLLTCVIDLSGEGRAGESEI